MITLQFNTVYQQIENYKINFINRHLLRLISELKLLRNSIFVLNIYKFYISTTLPIYLCVPTGWLYQSIKDHKELKKTIII